MPTKNEEDYLRIIYEIQSKSGFSVHISDIAKKLSISKSSVSEMVKHLEKQGFIERRPYSLISLSKEGIIEGRRILRKHRLLEVFYVDLLGMKDSFHNEAHESEHAISEKAELKLEKLLKNPKRCPDGDNIPKRDLEISLLCDAPLKRQLSVLFANLKKNEMARITSLGIVPNEKIKVIKKIKNGPIVILIKGCEIAIGKPIASKIYVEALR